MMLLTWTLEGGGRAVAHAFRTSMPAGIAPRIGFAGWLGLEMELLHYEAGAKYRVRFAGQAERDLTPMELQACADYLSRLLGRYMARAVG